MNLLASLVMVALCFVGVCLTAPVEEDFEARSKAPMVGLIEMIVAQKGGEPNARGDREGRDDASGFSLNPDVLNAARRIRRDIYSLADAIDTFVFPVPGANLASSNVRGDREGRDHASGFSLNPDVLNARGDRRKRDVMGVTGSEAKMGDVLNLNARGDREEYDQERKYFSSPSRSKRDNASGFSLTLVQHNDPLLQCNVMHQ